MKNQLEIDILTPISGVVTSLSDVPDPVFSQKIMGDGIAIDPTSNELKSPISGEIVQLHKACHAVSIRHESGIEILMHIGIETVQLGGDGFQPHIEVGQHVDVGTLLISFDLALVSRRAKSLLTEIIVLNSESYDLHLESISTKKLVTTKADNLFKVVASAPNNNPITDNIDNLEKETKTRSITIMNHNGLHARPASQIVAIAKLYAGDVNLIVDERRVNAKSLIAILGADIKYKDDITIEVIGSNATDMLDDLFDAISDGLGEVINTKINSNINSSESNAKKKVIKAPQGRIEDNKYYGHVASPGLVVGTIYQLTENDDKIPEDAASMENESLMIASAREKTESYIQKMIRQLQEQQQNEQANIFRSHLEILDDPEIAAAVTDYLEQGKTAAYAWSQAASKLADSLEKMDNSLLALRANDIRDVGKHMVGFLLGKETHEFSERLSNDTIVIAHDLSPSDTVSLGREKLAAFCTVKGGVTSHVAILARSLGIPALSGVNEALMNVESGTKAILDTDKKCLFIDPPLDFLNEVEVHIKELMERRQYEMEQAHKPARMTSGQTIHVMSNVGGINDAERAVSLGAEGVGLLRSEFLFLERDDAPTENQQEQIYRNIARIAGDYPTIIRTLDVGGDKPLSYVPMEDEDNPFLGIRGIRLCLRHTELFRTQIRALLKAAADTKIHIMFPMISDLAEIIETKKILDEEKAKLSISTDIPIGIMVEVPACALQIKHFMPYVDFVSIGSNDLAQYTLAMDRGQADFGEQIDGLHPSVLALIEHVAKVAKSHNVTVGVCGAMASDELAVPVLVGLGIEHLGSVETTIPRIKELIRGFDMALCESLASEALKQSSIQGVRELIKTWYAKHVSQKQSEMA